MGSRNNTSMMGKEITQLGWMAVGTLDATTSAADVTLAADERDYTSAAALTNSVVYECPPEIAYLEVRFILTTDNADVDIDIWAMRDGDTEMVRVCTLDVICGANDATGSYHFADTATVTNSDCWQSTPTAHVKADYQGVLHIETHGYHYFLFHGYGTFDEDCIVQVSGYSS